MDVVKEALADLARSGISEADAGAAGISAVDDATEAHAGLRKLPALVIPYYDVTGAPVVSKTGEEFFRVRYLEQVKAKGLGKRKDTRYGQPKGSGVSAYFPVVRGVDWEALRDNAKGPLVITEGEKKALAATLAGVPTIGLGGVFNWLQADALLPELAAFEWKDRPVYICFDSDAAKNPNILAAEARLAMELGVRRDADVRIARIPPPKDDGKLGIDDLLVLRGAKALHDVLDKAAPVRTMDRAVLKLNESVAWIEKDGLILDTDRNLWIQKTAFVKGSVFSSLKLPVPKADGTGIKLLSVADEWLTSPFARRYADVGFQPNKAPIVEEDGGVKLNLWRGFTAEQGDVAPWLRLTEHLMRNLPDEYKDFAHNLLAYKAQYPARKVPLAIVLLGPQGCGKSMWAQCVREAFSPYGAAISSHALLSEFNGWIENCLLGVFDEAQATHLTKGADKLKTLISEKRQSLRDLYRSARQVDSFAMYILTANDRRVGSYAQDDRRMFVIDTPKPGAESMYTECAEWLAEGGAKHLMHHLLTYDLKGWRPPQRAPMTAEKYMAYMESLTPVQRLAEEISTATQNTVKLWLDSAMEWALGAELVASTATRAREIKDTMGRIQVRPFYTPEELMLMFPAMAGQLHGLERGGYLTSGELSRQLRECGVTYLRNKDDPRGFMRHGRIQQFLVIAEPHKWSTPLTQAEFDAAMATFPEYRSL